MRPKSYTLTFTCIASSPCMMADLAKIVNGCGKRRNVRGLLFLNYFSVLKVEGSACAENYATTRKSTRKMDNSGPFLVDLLHCHYLSIPIILYM
jgi:hypothetical protein